MAAPALLTMSRPQYDRFVADVIALIRADRRIDLFEWVMHRVLLKSLKPHFEGPVAQPGTLSRPRCSALADCSGAVRDRSRRFNDTDGAAARV